MKTTLNIFPSFVLGIATALLVPFLATAVPVGPSGDYSQTVTNPADAVWNFSGAFTNANIDVTNKEGTVVQADITVDFSQTGAGKITGSAVDVPITVIIGGSGAGSHAGSFSFPATVTSKGSMTSAKGGAHLNLTVTATGTGTLPSESKSSKVTLSGQINATINNTNQTLTGSTKETASASGNGSIVNTTPFTNSISDVGPVGDGSWTLALTGLATTDNKVTGTATVTLNSGQEFNYTVKGTFSSTKGTLLLLSGENAASAGSTIQVTLDTSNAVTAIKGKICGQMVNVSF